MPLECDICGFEHGWLDLDDDVGDIKILCKDCMENHEIGIITKKGIEKSEDYEIPIEFSYEFSSEKDNQEKIGVFRVPKDWEGILIVEVKKDKYVIERRYSGD